MRTTFRTSGLWLSRLQDALDAAIDSGAQTEDLTQLSDLDQALATLLRQAMVIRRAQRSFLTSGALTAMEMAIFEPTPPVRDESPLFCEHANEMPQICRCRDTCYCQANSCQDRRWLSINVVRWIRTTLGYGPIRQTDMGDYLRRVAGISPTSLGGHLSQMLEVEEDGDGCLFQRPCYTGCEVCTARPRNESIMASICNAVSPSPLSVEDLREALVVHGIPVSDDELIETVRQLLARGRVLVVNGRMLACVGYTDTATEVVVPEEPRELSRFDIIDG
jgi:hypothetical protein